jgi:hypothetical protein
MIKTAVLAIAALKNRFKSSCTSMYIPVQNNFLPCTRGAQLVFLHPNWGA